MINVIWCPLHIHRKIVTILIHPTWRTILTWKIMKIMEIVLLAVPKITSLCLKGSLNHWWMVNWNYPFLTSFPCLPPFHVLGVAEKLITVGKHVNCCHLNNTNHEYNWLLSQQYKPWVQLTFKWVLLRLLKIFHLIPCNNLVNMLQQILCRGWLGIVSFFIVHRGEVKSTI